VVVRAAFACCSRVPPGTGSAVDACVRNRTYLLQLRCGHEGAAAVGKDGRGTSWQGASSVQTRPLRCHGVGATGCRCNRCNHTGGGSRAPRLVPRSLPAQRQSQRVHGSRNPHHRQPLQHLQNLLQRRLLLSQRPRPLQPVLGHSSAESSPSPHHRDACPSLRIAARAEIVAAARGRGLRYQPSVVHGANPNPIPIHMRAWKGKGVRAIHSVRAAVLLAMVVALQRR
jgi:hypothetical protein